MKVCPICKDKKNLSEFNSQGKYCRLCHNEKNKKWRQLNENKNKESHKKYWMKVSGTEKQKERQRKYSKMHYYNNKEAYLKRNKIRWRKIRAENVKWLIEYFKSHPCIDCPEKNPLTLTFDHVRGNKEFDISRAISNGSYSMKRIQLEIDKCEVRCANCHSKKTAMERNYLMYNMLKEMGL